MMLDGAINITWVWDGESLHPARGFEKRCDDMMVVGERYRTEVYQERSWVSHQHQFAWLHEAWLSLPDAERARWLNEDQLRRHALIAGGFCDCRSVACSSNAEAQRWYQFLTANDPYCVVKIEGNTLMHFTARSQSMRSMGSKEFQRSKNAVLDFVADRLGTDAKSVEEAA